MTRIASSQKARAPSPPSDTEADRGASDDEAGPANERASELEDETGADLGSLPARIVFFDGVCAFCDDAVRWLRDRDPAGRFYFAPLQGQTAARLRRVFPAEFPTEIDTLVYVERSGTNTRIDLRSEAVFRLCGELGGSWAAVAWLRVLPLWLTDFGYRVFARSRYRLFGRMDVCDVPTPSQRERLLP